jgi:hypothetical protein
LKIPHHILRGDTTNSVAEALIAVVRYIDVVTVEVEVVDNGSTEDGRRPKVTFATLTEEAAIPEVPTIHKQPISEES